MEQAAGLLIQRLDDGRILLARRSQDVAEPGVWGQPGGGIERGEDALTAAFREAHEELGPLPERILIMGEHQHRSKDFRYTTFHAMIEPDDAQAWTPSLNWENDAVDWFSVDALPPDTHWGVLEALETLNV